MTVDEGSDYESGGYLGAELDEFAGHVGEAGQVIRYTFLTPEAVPQIARLLNLA